MEIRPIKPGEERAAAALVYELTRGAAPEAGELGTFLEQAAALKTDLSRQVVAVAPEGTMVGCAMYFPLGDGSATVMTPLCKAGFDVAEVHVGLLRALIGKARAEEVRMLQVFTEEHDARTHATLEESGFEKLAVLVFMERNVTPADRNIAPDKQIRWIPWAAGRETEFADVIGRTYRATLDCRKLGESRDPSATLESYRVRNEIDPSLWLLAEVDGEIAACLLLLYHSEENAYELGYVGVVPEHRGKGLGRKVMEKGLLEVALRSSETKMRLAVDEENIPAVNVYQALAFVVSERKQVHFSLLATS